MDKSIMSRKDGAGVSVTVERITLHKGIAGQVSVVATVRHDWHGAPSDAWPNQSEASTWECVGSTFGGPFVAIMRGGQMFVRDPGRFGSFAADPREWMRRYVLNLSDFNLSD